MTPKRARSPKIAPVETPPKPAAPLRVRRLKWNERVRAGDFVAALQRGFELWEGPTGFRADSFVKPIYRRHNGRANDMKPGREVPA